MTEKKEKHYAYTGRVKNSKDPNRMIRIIVHPEAVKLLEALHEQTGWQQPSIIHLALIALANYHGLKKPPPLKIPDQISEKRQVTNLSEPLKKFLEKVEGKGHRNE